MTTTAIVQACAAGDIRLLPVLVAALTSELEKHGTAAHVLESLRAIGARPTHRAHFEQWLRWEENIREAWRGPERSFVPGVPALERRELACRIAVVLISAVRTMDLDAAIEALRPDIRGHLARARAATGLP